MLESDVFEPTLLSAMRKYWWAVAVMAVTGALVGLLIQSSIANDWVAEGSMLVENPEVSQLFDQQTTSSPERYTADQVAILESSAIALRAFQIAQDDPEVGSLDVGDVTSSVAIRSTPESGLIEVVVTNEEPDDAVAVANAVLEAYEESREEEAARGFDAAIAEFDSAIAAVDEELQALAGEIAQIRTAEEGDTPSVDSQLQAVIDEVLALMASGAATPDQLDALMQRLEALQLITGVQAEDPRLASLLEARNQALQRRSQLALRQDQLRVDASLTSTGIALMSPALEAQQAMSASRASAIGLLGGLVLGSLLSFALASRSRRFTHRAEPELILRAPLLAEVPDFEQEALTTDMPIRDAPMSAAAESFRFAAAAIANQAESRPALSAFDQSGGDAPAQVIAFASSLLGEGKSVVTSNLGVAAATKGRRVLMIDCDFGDSSLAKILGIPSSEVGITDVVDAALPLQRAVQRIEIGDGLSVDLLTRGSQNVTAPAFFRAPDTADFFQSVRSMYDLVLVDVPPVLQVAYAGSVMRLCEGTLIVVPHGSEVAKLAEALDRISLTNAQILGYIYNRSILRREMVSTEGSMSDPLGLGAEQGSRRAI